MSSSGRSEKDTAGAKFFYSLYFWYSKIMITFLLGWLILTGSIWRVDFYFKLSFFIFILIFLYFNQKSLSYLYSKLSFRTDVQHLGLRHRKIVTPRIYKTSLFERSFSYNVSKFYNSLPERVKQFSLTKFKNECASTCYLVFCVLLPLLFCDCIINIYILPIFTAPSNFFNCCLIL